MTERATAEIINFPQRRSEVVAANPVETATTELKQALIEQHEALVAWQGALTKLRDSLDHLGRNMRALNVNSRLGVGL